VKPTQSGQSIQREIDKAMVIKHYFGLWDYSHNTQIIIAQI